MHWDVTIAVFRNKLLCVCVGVVVYLFLILWTSERFTTAINSKSHGALRERSQRLRLINRMTVIPRCHRHTRRKKRANKRNTENGVLLLHLSPEKMDNSGKEKEAIQLMADADKKVKSSGSFLGGMFG